MSGLPIATDDACTASEIESNGNEVPSDNGKTLADNMSSAASLEKEKIESTPPLIGENDKPASSDKSGSETQAMAESGQPSAQPVTPKTYEDLSWRRLPLEVQEAAMRLGYTKEMWNEDLEPESSSKIWEELDPEEQEAAKVLGYDKITWNLEEEKSPKDYDPLSWKELPKRIQEAYSILGYDKDIWDKDKAHATNDKDWDELTEEEQEAATTIGYTAKIWNEDADDKDKAMESSSHNNPDPVVKEEPANTKKYEKCSWEDLPSEARDAAKLLGYTEEDWNESKEPEVSNKYWEELNTEEKDAARVLGYNEKRWNFGDKEVSPRDYDDMFWNQLPKKIQDAYRLLGYNEDLWDKDDSPGAIDKDWDDLTEEEKNGATIVGYTETTWDDDSDDEDDDAEPQNELTGIRREVSEFLIGSSYVLLDCMSMSAFFGVIESIFMVGKLFLSDNTVNAIKIVVGLSIMQFSGQLRKWLGAEKETKKARSRKKREETTLFRSFLNVFSWWTMFAGVNHFFYAFKKDYLYTQAEEWFRTFYEAAEEAFEAELKSGTASGKITCSYVQDFHFNQSIRGYLIGKACELSENDWESVGHFYYVLVFVASALPLWFLFGDNFLKGCDV